MSKIPIPEHLLPHLGPEMKMDVHWIDVKLTDGRTLFGLVARGGNVITGREGDRNGEGPLDFGESDILNIRRHLFRWWPVWPKAKEDHRPQTRRPSLSPRSAAQAERRRSTGSDDVKPRTWLYLMIDGKYRCWEDFQRYAFLSAGHASPDSAPLRELRPGDTVYAYSAPRGYFAKGQVTSSAVRPRDFIVKGPFVHLQDGSPAGDSLPLDEVGTQRLYLRHDQETELSEWVVGVRWEKVYPRRKAKSCTGMEIPESAAVEAHDPVTMRFLDESFKQT